MSLRPKSSSFQLPRPTRLFSNTTDSTDLESPASLNRIEEEEDLTPQ